ncbi:cytochrome b [Allorhizobium sp. BGMRC 0089]|uniref:cytochrome b n=1 Tax=Allorhizobium sonneratiae TaxID=2934936 RepID=UPI0020345DC3|nr:cytochrome b [Allorhizobium sonneratiae]MCM2292502.1 cytochrome b [Allorhizobium sonneratiae]
MIETLQAGTRIRYPLSMRVLHWLRAILILGLIASGWFMTGRAEDDPTATIFYPNHKQFGVLAWLLALVHLTLRFHLRAVLPHPPQSLKPWEKWLSHSIHRVIMALTVLTPMLGYAMSTSLPDGDGVPFFVRPRLPEFLPKSDAAFSVFQALHQYSAYLLLACILLHVAGTVKHRFEDRNGETDVLPRML